VRQALCLPLFRSKSVMQSCSIRKVSPYGMVANQADILWLSAERNQKRYKNSYDT
jgi:hypothetical protein